MNNPNVLQLKAMYLKKLLSPHSDWPPRVVRAYKFLNTFIVDQRLTVAWVKARCRINGNNFTGKFKYYVGLSPQEYIKNIAFL